MKDTKRANDEKSFVTPLAIIALFLGIVEIALSVVIVNTDGQIQLLITWFTILFTAAVLVGFFLILWSRPHHFYSPYEYGITTDIQTYTRAIRGQVEILEPSDKSMTSKEQADWAWDKMVNYLIGKVNRTDPLYTDYLLAVKNREISFEEHGRIYYSFFAAEYGIPWEAKLPILSQLWIRRMEGYFGYYVTGLNKIFAGIVIAYSTSDSRIRIELPPHTVETIIEEKNNAQEGMESK